MRTTALIWPPTSLPLPDAVVLECESRPVNGDGWTEIVHEMLNLQPGRTADGRTAFRWVAVTMDDGDYRHMRRFLRQDARASFFTGYYLFAEVREMMEITPIYPAEAAA